MSAVVQPDSGELTVLMTKAEAEDVTLKIKQYAGMLCHLVKEAHDKQAWKAMGYGTWAAYCKAEFDYSRSYSYRLIGHVNRLLELSAAADLSDLSPMGDTVSERATRDLDVPAAAAEVADRVADLPDDATDADRAEVVKDVVAEQGSAAVRAARDRREREAAEAERLAAMTPEERGIARANAQQIPDAVDASADPSGEQQGDLPAGLPAAPTTPGQNDEPVDADPDSDRTGSPVAHADVAGASEGNGCTGPSDEPDLPTDWRERIGYATYLLACPAEQVAAVIGDDDIADLTSLGAWLLELTSHLAIKEQNA